MSDKSAIEWTEATWNPVTGCSKVSPGCAHCYAETISLRFGRSAKPWTPENATENVVLHPERLDQPLRWKRPRMVFVNSMSDLFHELVPFEYVVRVFETMRAARRHTFQVLTKRPELAREHVRRYYELLGTVALGQPVTLPDDVTGFGALENVWLGVSIENARFTRRADALREIPAAVRFISAEPLLGSLLDTAGDLDTHPQRARLLRAIGDGLSIRETAHMFGIAESTVKWHWKEAKKRPLNLAGIDWLIAGGESGHEHRPLNLDHARELRDACQAAGVAFFFKQVGGRTPKSGGRELDGREWNEMPREAVLA